MKFFNRIHVLGQECQTATQSKGNGATVISVHQSCFIGVLREEGWVPAWNERANDCRVGAQLCLPQPIKLESYSPASGMPHSEASRG